MLKLYDETIIKFNLLINKNISSDLMEEINHYNNEIAAYYLAINYLTKKMRTRLEVEKMLTKKEYNYEIIEKVIDQLTLEGYLDEEKYIQSYINDQFHMTNNGPYKIIKKLKELGIDENKVVIDKDFSEKLRKIIERRVKANSKYPTKALINNISNYLISLGYSHDMFKSFLENLNVNEEDLIEKDYQKIYLKYHNKVDDNKLKLHLKNKLYQKGYQIELINEIIAKEENYETIF